MHLANEAIAEACRLPVRAALSAVCAAIYRRPSYYAMQNVYSVFDDDTHALGHETAKSGGRDLTCCRFSRLGHDWRLYWFSDAPPSSDRRREHRRRAAAAATPPEG